MGPFCGFTHDFEDSAEVWCVRWIEGPLDSVFFVQLLCFSDDLLEVYVSQPFLKSLVRFYERSLDVSYRDGCSPDIMPAVGSK